MNKEQEFIFEKYKENNPNAVSKEEYLKKLYDIKNTPLPVVIGRTGGGMSFNTKELTLAHLNIIDQLDKFINMVEKATCFL